MGRVDGIDVCESFFIASVRGNISIGFKMIIKKHRSNITKWTVLLAHFYPFVLRFLVYYTTTIALFYILILTTPNRPPVYPCGYSMPNISTIRCCKPFIGLGIGMSRTYIKPNAKAMTYRIEKAVSSLHSFLFISPGTLIIMMKA
jgi:hypothetical protein